MQSRRSIRRTNRFQIVLLLPLLALSAEVNAQSPSPGDVAARVKQLRGQLAPIFILRRSSSAISVNTNRRWCSTTGGR